MRWLSHLAVVLGSAAAFILALFLPLPWLGGAALLVIGVGGSIYAVRLADATEKRRALRHMEGREPLVDAEFGRRFFSPEQAEIAAKLRAIMARHIAVDLSQLHPDDRIVEDIRMDALDSMSTVEFIVDVEKEFAVFWKSCG